MPWTDQLLGQPGNYTPILQTLTPGDGLALEALYNVLNAHATATGSQLTDYVSRGTGVDCSEQIGDPESPITFASIQTLKALGLVITQDGIHIGITPLALAFLASVQGIPPL